MQVGSISQNWDGVLKTIVAKADRFSIDFPPNIGKKKKYIYINLFSEPYDRHHLAQYRK
jgi:hypothetical protein